MAPRQILNIAKKTISAIYAAYESMPQTPQSPHIRCSEIGHECYRYIWFKYNWCFEQEFEGRMLRLFDTGNKEEARVYADLERIGCKVVATQYEVVSESELIKGHIDGVVIGIPEDPKTPHLLEIKTHSLKSFEKLQERGVGKAKPQHYAQMQLYMYLAKPQLEKALYFAVNKNTDEIYCEIIRLDQKSAQNLIGKGKQIARSYEMPVRAKDTFEYQPCKYCDFNRFCFQNNPNTLKNAVLPARNCRTCAKSLDCTVKPADELGCGHHIFKTCLVPFTELHGDVHETVYLTLDGKRICDKDGEFKEIA